MGHGLWPNRGPLGRGSAGTEVTLVGISDVLYVSEGRLALPTSTDNTWVEIIESKQFDRRAPHS